jgi:hypothetical protein
MPMRSMPMRYAPVRYMPMRYVPMEYMPLRRMPMRCIPMRYTPMRCTPLRCCRCELLEYAYRNLGNFDAIFWIQCETSASLRQSIADAANELNLPGASQSGHFEENLVSTHNWLKRTSKRWLLVFDNALMWRASLACKVLDARAEWLISITIVHTSVM